MLAAINRRPPTLSELDILRGISEIQSFEKEQGVPTVNTQVIVVASVFLNCLFSMNRSVAQLLSKSRVRTSAKPALNPPALSPCWKMAWLKLRRASPQSMRSFAVFLDYKNLDRCRNCSVLWKGKYAAGFVIYRDRRQTVDLQRYATARV